MLRQLSEGLDSLGFLSIMEQIPTVFETLFVYHDQEIDGETVMSCFSIPRNLPPIKAKSVDMLERFIKEASETGQFSPKFSLILYTTKFSHSDILFLS